MVNVLGIEQAWIGGYPRSDVCRIALWIGFSMFVAICVASSGSSRDARVDGQAMVAGNELSSADSVIITAKISANGDALSTVPGFETHSDPVMTADPGFVILDLGQ